MSVLFGSWSDQAVNEAMSNTDLRGRLEQDNAELARSNRELEEFAYVASHDLEVSVAHRQRVPRSCCKAQKGEQLDEDEQMYGAS